MLKFLLIATAVTAAGFALPMNPNNTRIIGGSDIDITDVPYQLLFLEFTILQVCGAALIAPKWAVTTAQCAAGNWPWSVRAGTSIRNEGGQQVDVVNVFIPSQFEFAYTMDYDIAVLELAEEITIPTAASIPLADANTVLEPGTMGLITGWGRERPGATSNPFHLKGVEVPIVSYEDCAESIGADRLTPRTMCAGYLGEGGKDGCWGDYGGPIVVDGKLVGVMSWSFECASSKYVTVYTSIVNEEIREFIRENSGV